MATVFTVLALAITVSQSEPGYTYKGTNILIGPVHPVLGAEVGVAAEVGLEVAGFVVAARAVAVGAAVGLDVAAGLVAEGFVAAAVGLVVLVELVVAGIDVGAEVAALPAYVTPVSTIPTEGEVMMSLMMT